MPCTSTVLVNVAVGRGVLVALGVSDGVVVADGVTVWVGVSVGDGVTVRVGVGVMVGASAVSVAILAMVVASIRCSNANATASASAVWVEMLSSVDWACALRVAARWVLERVGVKVLVGVWVMVGVSVLVDVAVFSGVLVTSGVSLCTNTTAGCDVGEAVAVTELLLFIPEKTKNDPTPNTAKTITPITHKSGLLFGFCD